MLANDVSTSLASSFPREAKTYGRWKCTDIIGFIFNAIKNGFILLHIISTWFAHGRSPGGVSILFFNKMNFLFAVIVFVKIKRLPEAATNTHFIRKCFLFYVPKSPLRSHQMFPTEVPISHRWLRHRLCVFMCHMAIVKQTTITRNFFFRSTASSWSLHVSVEPKHWQTKAPFSAKKSFGCIVILNVVREHFNANFSFSSQHQYTPHMKTNRKNREMYVFSVARFWCNSFKK